MPQEMPYGNYVSLDRESLSDRYVPYNHYQYQHGMIHQGLHSDQATSAVMNDRWAPRTLEACASSGSFDCQVNLEETVQKQNVTDYTHPIQQVMQQYATDSSHKTSPSSIDSPTPSPDDSNSLVRRHIAEISLKPIHIDGKVEIPLISHKSTEPRVDSRYPEYFDETMLGVFARVFLLKEIHSRLTISCCLSQIFDGMMLFGIGVLMRGDPELKYHFLRHRGAAMKYVTKELSNITDDNAKLLLILSSVLTSTCIYMKDAPMKDHFSLSQGPSALIIAAMQNPDKFPTSFMRLKNFSDGLLFTSRFVYHPAYDHKVLYEFLEVVEEFGEKFLSNEDLVDNDDEIHIHYENLIEYIKFSLNFMENEKSDKHVLRFPVNKIHMLLQKWFEYVPSAGYTINSDTNPVDKVVFSFWNALAEVMEEILVGCRYIFTFLFNGFHWLFPLDKNALFAHLDDQFRDYTNYSCRLIAYIVRRRHFIVRNTILNDPIPTFFDAEDRFKPRMFHIEEQCVTRFRSTIIQPYHYPTESFISKASAQGDNYYRGAATKSAKDTAIIHGMETLNQDDGCSEKVDLIGEFNQKTCLLNKDHDPRFSDPTFNDIIHFQSADLTFIKKYNEDRKLIIQLDT
jgi:hypothetical protein